MKCIIPLLVMLLIVCLSGQVFAQDEPEPFDLNHATIEQLMSIPDADITEDIAKAIIAAAKEKPFKYAEDLMDVPGIDNSILESINPVEENGSLWYDPDNAEMTFAPSKC
ncbi:helix-hairpin-helix domain-containing protein [Desulfoplanes formicivorans]|uniref:Competence protein ComEA n=1 Tax=Desulfoplanes formicivorans TaxID=1592317 RepID=A0A194AHF6_9BACT|nr:helix-hairpin-helix domain-containing protein [Desulfoplanes formicivorans]GAU09517.1 competence protein ComEA [Desulfoplanes formicivorans]